ncbi:MAG: hypothetical protein KDA88_00195 [Planctomycetaceae bacterium]|nr:hypothetical protein [Planctomycetaceae bacterium]MCB9950274.1 hypothetical protein [Planctomycetaceae bacterium]
MKRFYELGSGIAVSVAGSTEPEEIPFSTAGIRAKMQWKRILQAKAPL